MNLIIGGTGLIGSYLVKKLGYNYTYKTNPQPHGFYLDITNDIDFSFFKPEIVIHTAALTNVDQCQTDQSLAYEINVKGTENIISACKKYNSKIIFISTSNVFPGNKSPYYEDDKPEAINYYGQTKLIGEQLIQDSGLEYLILRTDQPYGWKEPWQRDNTVLRMISKLTSTGHLEEITDWYNNYTYLPDFANAVKKLIDMKLTGIFHVCGKDFTYRYDFARMAADIFKLNKDKIKPIHSSKLNLPAQRPNVCMNNDKLFKMTGFKMSGFEGLKMMREAK